MPAPAFLVPVAYKIAQGAALAAFAYWAGRRGVAGPGAIWREKALDETPDGLEVETDRGPDSARAGAAWRWRRTLRRPGGAMEVDLAAVFRARVRRVDLD